MIRKFQKECESSCEYILPDYLGDVKRLVSTSARAVPSGQFGSDTETECAGIVTWEVVYLDTENKLTSANFTSDYDFSFATDAEKHVDAYVTTEISNFAVRLTGPRRMIAKANVTFDVCAIERWEPKAEGSGFLDAEELEKITKTISIENALRGGGAEREYAEEAATLEGIAADEIEVITSNAYVRISESVPVEGGVNIKGVLVVTAIIRTPDTAVFAIRREIPFDETVSIDGATPDMSAISEAVISSVTCGVSESENASLLTANVILEFNAAVFYNENVEITKDAYLKSKDTEAEYENQSFTTHLGAETKCGSVSLKVPRSELDIGNLRELLSLNADFKGLSVDYGAKAPKIYGDVAFSGVACEIFEDERINISSLKFTLPVDVEVNLSCQNTENCKFNAKITPAGCEWDIDAENLNIKLWYNLSYSLGEAKCEKYLATCEASGDIEYKKSSSRICVYYPDECETLFDVAKKFHTTVKDIAADNMIAEPTALGSPVSLGLKKLIIR